MSRQEILNQLINDYIAKTNVEGVAIVNNDGFIVHSSLNPKMDENEVGAITGLLSSVTDRMKDRFNTGMFKNAEIETDEFRFIFLGCDVNKNITLVTITPPIFNHKKI